MAITEVTRPSVLVETRGKVPRRMAGLATAKIDSQLRRVPGRVLSARVTLTMAADPAVEQPAVASVNVDLNGRLVRAQAASESMRGAIEQLASRLRVRLDRAEGWRQRSIPARRPDYFPRPAAERSVICQVSRAGGKLTAVEAADELDLLDYDFLLFTEVSTGADAMIGRSGGGYLLTLARAESISVESSGVESSGVESIRVSDQPAPRLVAADAITRLEALGEHCTFYLDRDSGRGNVVYLRHDGNYGLLTPPTSR